MPQYICSLFFVRAQMRRLGNIFKSVPTQGWQNDDSCEVAGAVRGDKCQGDKCRRSISLNFNNHFPQGLALKFVNSQSLSEV